MREMMIFTVAFPCDYFFVPGVGNCGATAFPQQMERSILLLR